MSANFKAYLMLTLCAFFWAGNFIVGKFATLYEVPPLTLNFFRWLLVAMLSWAIYSTMLKTHKTGLNYLTFISVIVTLGLFFLFPQYLSIV
jgi:drug/metabolite transporter (DMT)-like permease